MADMYTEVVVSSRMYLPPEDKTRPNERKAFHPETNSTMVLCNQGRNTLDDYLPSMPVLCRNEGESEGYIGTNTLIFEIEEKP